MNELDIYDFAKRSFRDSADQDYICARVAYRNVFDQQFKWCALQAIEKYLKAILIMNLKSAKGIGHNLRKGLEKVQAIDDLDFTLSQDTVGFIHYISDFGSDRYFSHPTFLRDGSFFLLDRAVWSIRRYCFPMRITISHRGKDVDLFEKNKAMANSQYYVEYPHKYKIRDGYLEKIITKKSAPYDDLIWKNFFYGRIKKHKIKNAIYRTSSANPTHSMRPESFEDIASLVDFPKHVRDQFRTT